MKLTFLGSGSAFTTGGNFHSNMMLENHKGDRILLDCGTDARHSLFELGFSHNDIQDVYISHLHADHAGGLEWLGFTRKFDPNCALAKLHITEELVEIVWNNMLAGSMRSIEHLKCELSTYFDVHPIKKADNFFLWQDHRFDLIPVTHVFDNEHRSPCSGLRYQINGKWVWWTADLVFKPDELMHLYQTTDLIFHDCETSPFRSTVHPHFQELLQLPEDIRKKMWLYHYNPGALPDAVVAGFKGFVEKGQVFDLTKI